MTAGHHETESKKRKIERKFSNFFEAQIVLACKVIEALIQCHLCNDKLCSKSIISFPVVFRSRRRRGDYLVLKNIGSDSVSSASSSFLEL